MKNEFANGIEYDGIKYRVYFKDAQYVAEVTHPDGRAITEKWKCAYKPICGMDVSDNQKLEEVLESMINSIRVSK